MRTKLRIAGSIVLLAVLAMRIDWGRIGAVVLDVDVSLWLAPLGLYVLVQLASSLRWQLLARPLGFDQPAFDFVRYTFIGMFFGLFLPAVGNDVVRAWYLDAGSGRKRTALVTVLLDR